MCINISGTEMFVTMTALSAAVDFKNVQLQYLQSWQSQTI